MSEQPALVLTGASGLIGRRLVQALRADPDSASAFRHITLLVRSPSSLAPLAPLPETWRIVEWDLAGAAALPAGVLGPDSVVLHLAASTGRATARTMHATIVEGTRRLAEACRTAGVRHLIVVSSIAAGFADRRWYPYAEAKREAEEIARRSGVPLTLVRPTMVFGRGSPVQEGLERMASGLVPVLFGKGQVQVQPIEVDDLASALVAITRAPPSGEELLEIGGGDRCTLRELLVRIRAARGLPPRPVVSLPLALTRRLLAALEPILGARLPVSAGQLASFVNPSIAAPHPVVQRLLPAPRSLAVMLGSATEPTPGVAREFGVMARYLGCPDPGPDATAAYLRAHSQATDLLEDALDRRLRRVAGWSHAGCALADSYARIVRPYGTLRRTLVLALAVLESTAKNHAAFDSAKVAPAARTWLAIGGHGLAWMAWTLTAVVALGPPHLMDRLRGRLAGGPVG